jgi:bifunctional non-homologous end joining protein LigD
MSGSTTRKSTRAPREPRPALPAGAAGKRLIPRDADTVEVRVAGRAVTLTHLRKVFWPELGLTKGDLLQFYVDVAPVLLPHLADRAMVMKRYPDGAAGPFFFMKRAPSPRPPWIETCAIEHGSGGVIDFPIIQDLASLLWVINLGCIDLNPWYARCDDVDRPDYLHFDLDPVKDTPFPKVRDTALVLREALDGLGMPSYPKTTGSKGLHVYVPIVRGPTQKEVWHVAKGHGPGAGAGPARADHGGVPDRQATAGTRARRLQPERLGPNARLRLLGAPAAAGNRLGPGELG